jgi:hypothetical protein
MAKRGASPWDSTALLNRSDRAIRARLLHRPGSFLLPPRQGPA